jgi:hypothetical protein
MSYFTNRNQQMAASNAPIADQPTLPRSSAPAAQTRVDDDMSKIDTDLDDRDVDAAADFKSDTMPNIWTLGDDQDDVDKTEDNNDNNDGFGHDANGVDPNVDKPSFLRRLARRHKDDDNSDKAP